MYSLFLAGSSKDCSVVDSTHWRGMTQTQTLGSLLPQDGATDDREAMSMSDLRTLVRELLGVQSVYASADASEVRCLVETPKSEAADVQEWLIRRLPREETPINDGAPGVSAESEQDNLERLGSLEDYLDSVLHLTNSPRADRRVEEGAVGSKVLDLLYSGIRYYSKEQSPTEILGGLSSHHAKARKASFPRLRGVVVIADGSELAVFDYEQQTLQDLLQFNRARLDGEDAPSESSSDMKRRFLVFQLCQLLGFLHENKLSFKGKLTPSSIGVTDGLWARVGVVPSRVLSENDHIVLSPTLSVEDLSTTSPTERWCRGDMSNYEYLMMLNTAAGRRMIDSAFHPVLPWVSDFSSRKGGWRDLSKSKFRLNKGDNQLDRNYESSVIPHHITESLSEITYYIYMARRTPMTVLRQVVRSNFQPREYPSTMARMFHWTPDECIPEFFTDPSVFESIHGGDVMPDMVLPDWCHDAQDFVLAHRAMLESDEVSSTLHKWIDLNFGVCLSGEEAIRNKNVPFRTKLGVGSTRKSPGFFQLFSRAHPRRRVPQYDHVAAVQAQEIDASRTIRDRAPPELIPDTNLRVAIKIVEDSLNESSMTAFSDPAPHGQLQGILCSPPQAERKGLSSSFVKLKKRSKARPKLHHSFHDPPPPSPPGGREPGMSRSPTVTRFAHAIPKFFGADSPVHQASGGGDSSGSTSTVIPATAMSSSFGPSNADTSRGQPITKYTASSSTNQPQNVLNSSIGVHGSPGTHLFRDLWHQLSKPDDEDSNDTMDEGNSLSDSDWIGLNDNDALDETSYLLLRASPSIDLPLDSVANVDQLHEEQSPDLIVPIDPVYTLPAYVQKISKIESFSHEDVAISDDLFALGCIIAEIYLGRPLFSSSSIEHYWQSYASESESNPEHTGDIWLGLLTVRNQLSTVPICVKDLITNLIHPNPQHRLASWLSLSNTNVNVSSSADLSYSSSGCIFNPTVQSIFQYSAVFHGETDWSERFKLTRKYLPGLCRLPDETFEVVLPTIIDFFKPTTFSDELQTAHACAATVFFLCTLATRCGHGASRFYLCDAVLSLYETAKLSPFLKLCLATPEVLKTIAMTFGPVKLLHNFLPVLMEWLTSPALYRSNQGDLGSDERNNRSLMLFVSESASMLAVSCGELSSSDILGASMTVKYILPVLLPVLGKVQSKWVRLSEDRFFVRHEMSATSESNGSLYGGKHGDGVHVAYTLKQNLYENHFVADTILLVSRELPTAVLSETVLSHLCNVVPRLLEVAESVSSVRIEGVPDDLAREVYVSLRVLRHVIRSVDDQTVRREILQKRSGLLVGILNRIQPPFLHPRVIDSIMDSMAETTKQITDRPSLHRYSSAPVSTSIRRSKQIVDHLIMLQNEKAHDLRAFTAVGVARTITGTLQKVGAEVASTATGLLQSIDAFLVRCATIYSELEITDFQWRMASEVVSEFCAPLRTLLGPDKFTEFFPSVQSSSVLQLLLLPNPQGHVSARARTSDARQSLRQTTIATSGTRGHDESSSGFRVEVELLAKKMPELLQSAYQSARTNGIKTASFLHVPLRSGSAWSNDLNEEIYLVQEYRKKRRAVSSSSKVVGDSVWLRPRVTSYFTGRHEDSTKGAGSHRASVPSSEIGSSWALHGEIRYSMRAHSSVMRSISVDQDEQFVVTASKNGSCRSWRLASYPSQAASTVHIDTTSLLSAKSLEDGKQAVAISSSSVHVWDIRTSQVMFGIPFPDEGVTSCTTLRSLPYRHYLDFTRAQSTSTSREGGVLYGGADFAVGTVRKLHLVDARTAPRVVADWRVDARESTCISALSFVSTPTSPIGLIATGTTTGQVLLTDKRMGRSVVQWQALHESRVVKIVQYAPSYLLVVGSEREARVWKIDGESEPQLRMIVANVPEGVREPQISVQAYADSVILYVASSAKLYTTRLIHDASPEASRSNVVNVRLESWSLYDNIGSADQRPSSNSTTERGVNDSPDRSRLPRTKMSAQSLAVLPLRQVILLGGEDGSLRTCV